MKCQQLQPLQSQDHLSNIFSAISPSNNPPRDEDKWWRGAFNSRTVETSVFTKVFSLSPVSINQAPLQQSESIDGISSVRWSRSQLANDCNFIDKVFRLFGKFIHRLRVEGEGVKSHAQLCNSGSHTCHEAGSLLECASGDLRAASMNTKWRPQISSCLLASRSVCSRFMWRSDFLITCDKIKRGCRICKRKNAHFHLVLSSLVQVMQWTVAIKNYRKR